MATRDYQVVGPVIYPNLMGEYHSANQAETKPQISDSTGLFLTQISCRLTIPAEDPLAFPQLIERH